MNNKKLLAIPPEHSGSQTVKAIATQYRKDILPENASKRLRVEIALNEELSQELEALGWQSKHRFFTPLQLQAVVNHFGPFW